ncbi:MAG: HEAT repeat domain-containing protein [Deltaproteobacteria bacterium]|nr:HEAT repeat domain-containing protein [Deltaproteobacteria bacterium]
MWRRWGDYLYAITVLVVFGAEALALAALSLAFFARLLGLLPYTRLLAILTWVVILTCVSLAVVMQHVLVYYAASAWRERTRRERSTEWTELFVRWLFDRTTPVPQRLPREAVDALLDLRETIRGEDGAAIGELIERLGIGARLMARTRSHNFATRLQAVEGLAKARLPSALDAAFQLLDDQSAVVRFMATRVIARTLASLPPGEERERQALRLAERLRVTDLPTGVVEEALLLLDDAAEPVVRVLLQHEGTRPKIVRAALDAAGRLDLSRLSDLVARFLTHPDAELRAAALQCAPRLHLPPEAIADTITKAAEEPIEFVRVQATRALAIIPQSRALPCLWVRLHDASWWVRRAAAETLRGLGPAGVAVLRRADERHPDRFARQMAHHILTEARLAEVP